MGKSGDIIEVKLKDDFYDVYFKAKASIQDKKQMEELKKKLKEKGVDVF